MPSGRTLDVQKPFALRSNLFQIADTCIVLELRIARTKATAQFQPQLVNSCKGLHSNAQFFADSCRDSHSHSKGPPSALQEPTQGPPRALSGQAQMNKTQPKGRAGQGSAGQGTSRQAQINTPPPGQGRAG